MRRSGEGSKIKFVKEMLAIPQQDDEDILLQGLPDRHEQDEKPLVELTHKIISRLGLINTTVTPHEYLPAHSFGTNLRNLQRLLFREAGIVAAPNGTWSVRAAFAKERFEEKTKAFWQLLQKIGEWQAVQRHLLPLFALVVHKRRDRALALVLLDILNILLAPLVREDDDQKTAYSEHLSELLHYQRIYTRVLLEGMPSLGKLLLASIDDGHVVGCSLQLLNGLLGVPDAKTGIVAGYGSTMAVVRVLNSTGVMEFLMTAIACLDADEGAAFVPMLCELVEIFAHIFPLLLGDLERHRPFFAARKSATLQAIIKDDGGRQSGGGPIRHSRFSGHLTVRLSTGEDYIIKSSTQVLDGSKALEFDSTARPRHRRQLGETPVVSLNCRVTSPSDVKLMHRLSIGFLESCFNALLLHVAGRFAELRLNARFHWAFLRLTAYFVSFVNLQANERPEQSLFPAVYGILSVDIILFYSRYIHELASTRQWTPLIDCISWFKQILRLLHTMHRSTSLPEVVDAGKTVESNLVYHFHAITELRQVMIDIKNPSARTMLELVEANHALLQLIDAYCDTNRHIVTRRAKRRRRPAKQDSDDDEEGEEGSEDDFVERTVNFEGFVADYSHEHIVDLHINLLGEGMDTELGGSIAPASRQTGWLTVDQQAHIAWFLTQLYSTAPSLFHRISVLDCVYRSVLLPGSRKASSHAVHKSLYAFCKLLVRDIVQWLRSDPNALVFLCTIQRKSRSTVSNGSKADNEADADEEEAFVEFASTEQVDYLVRRLVHEHDCGSAIQTWLRPVFLEAAADRYSSSGDIRSFGLCCTNDTQRRAMRKAMFKSLLCALGCKRVAGSDWVISQELSASDLIERADLLETAVRRANDASEKDVEIASNSDGAGDIEGKLGQRLASAKSGSNKHSSHRLFYGQEDAGDLCSETDRSDQSISHDELAEQLFGGLGETVSSDVPRKEASLAEGHDDDSDSVPSRCDQPETRVTG